MAVIVLALALGGAVVAHAPGAAAVAPALGGGVGAVAVHEEYVSTGGEETVTREMPVSSLTVAAEDAQGLAAAPAAHPHGGGAGGGGHEAPPLLRTRGVLGPPVQTRTRKSNFARS